MFTRSRARFTDHGDLGDLRRLSVAVLVAVLVGGLGSGLQAGVDVAAQQQSLNNGAHAELRGYGCMLHVVERTRSGAGSAPHSLVVNVRYIAEAERDDQAAVDKQASDLARGALGADGDQRLKQARGGERGDRDLDAVLAACHRDQQCRPVGGSRAGARAHRGAACWEAEFKRHEKSFHRAGSSAHRAY